MEDISALAGEPVSSVECSDGVRGLAEEMSTLVIQTGQTHILDSGE